MVGAGNLPHVRIDNFSLTPKTSALGGNILISVEMQSLVNSPQRLLVDYIVHYVKQSGATSPKVFKWKEFVLPAGGKTEIKKKHAFGDLSTRRHFAGTHGIDLMINGVEMAKASVKLTRPAASVSSSSPI